MEPVARRKWFLLCTASALSLGLYVWLAWRYPLGPSLADPRAGWASLAGATWPNAAGHLLVYLTLTLLYLAILKLLAPNGMPAPSRRGFVTLVVIGWLACSAALLFASPAGESHDVFDYLFRARMQTEYRVNPLVSVPESLGLSAPYIYYLAWRTNVDTYGPVWEAASAAVSAAVHQTAVWLGWWTPDAPICPHSFESCRLLATYISAYRLLAILLTGLSGGLIAAIVGRERPELVPLALAAWFLNPLTLAATTLGAHNDAVMLALVLLGWWLLQRGRLFLGLMFLILAAHVKLTALIWLPACGLWIVWQYGWRRALKIGLSCLVCGAALSWLLYAPYGGWGSLPRMLQERTFFLANSIWEILQTMFRTVWVLPGSRAHQITTQLPNLLFGLGGLILPIWMFNFRPARWRRPPSSAPEAVRVLWQALAFTSLLYLSVGSFWFQGWYILWLLAPAVLLPSGRLTGSVLPWLAFGALSSNLLISYYLTISNAAITTASQPLQAQLLSFSLIWTPAVLALIISWSSRRLKLSGAGAPPARAESR